MTEIGRPYDPRDPDEERTFTTMMPTRDLMPLIDTSGGIQLADREGVWAHSFRCRACTLHFVLFSWSLSRHSPETITCPECGATDGFLHRITQLSTSTTFSLAPDRDAEIYDVWPFRLGAGGAWRAVTGPDSEEASISWTCLRCSAVGRGEAPEVCPDCGFGKEASIVEEYG